MPTMDDIALGFIGAMASIARAMPFLWHEFDGIGVDVNRDATFERAPSFRWRELFRSSGKCIRPNRKQGGVTVAGVVVVIKTCAVACAARTVGDGRVGYLARCLRHEGTARLPGGAPLDLAMRRESKRRDGVVKYQFKLCVPTSMKIE